MDYTAEELEDLAEMRERRLRLRAIADAKIAECQAMPAAKSWLDMGRQLRAVMAVDRLVVALWSPPPRRRRRPRSPSPSFPSPIEAPARPNPPPAPVVSPPPAAEPAALTTHREIVAEATQGVIETINTFTRACAAWMLVWPDGTIFDPNEINWRRHALTEGFTLPDDDRDPDIWMSGEILGRCNAIARQSGRLTGTWLNDKPYSERDPDYFSLSANFATGIEAPAKGEQPGPPGVPWWVVHRLKR